ncbi:MAG TPA: VOC family protein [Streptosporangiaceae bacterium]|nr:VOC family protein [Streptosporangiaceae bacterium]
MRVELPARPVGWWDTEPMALAVFKDLCVDADDPSMLGGFWGKVLDRVWEPKEDSNGEGLLRGPTPQHTIWVNRVPEPRTVKHRVHLDVYAASLADLEALGAMVVEPQQSPRMAWTVMADPEGGEFCAFLRPDVPAERLHGLVVDSADYQAQAKWWAAVYGVQVTENDGWSTLEEVPGMPILTMDFVPVPEPKTVKNRIHWDVTVPSMAPLLDAGARVLREPDDEVHWHVLADPEGNEFCAFT